ncbi:unnamed protein product [Vicia faba]|uniref:Uncharacterized protein n=1 Tax=Vicia faba TaxID=3906 RepID=A0AAV0ZRU2_VICFA|nr:unnamed protein product [Vicia faba]
MLQLPPPLKISTRPTTSLPFIHPSPLIPLGISVEPQSSCLKDKKKGEGDFVVKELFVQDVLRNNYLLHVLGKESPVLLLPRSSVDISICSKLRVGCQQQNVNPGFSINVCNSKGMNFSKGFVYDVGYCPCQYNRVLDAGI